MVSIRTFRSEAEQYSHARGPWFKSRCVHQSFPNNLKRLSLTERTGSPGPEILRYYNQIRTHLALEMDAPEFGQAQWVGAIVAWPLLGGLHHHYVSV
jgi:hypothetical protein